MDVKNHSAADSYYEFSRNGQINAGVLKEDISADVVVIGGGLTGCSTALHLAQRGADVAVLEARHFGWGASGRSGGQIGPGYAIDQQKLEKLVGMEYAKVLWEQSVASVAYTRELVNKYKIRCDLTMGYLHVGVKPRHALELQQWMERLSHRYGYNSMQYHGKDDLYEHIGSNLYCGGVSDAGGGHLHPLNYCLGIARAARQTGARLFQGSNVQRIIFRAGKKVVCTEHGSIRCDQVVYACNAYMDGLAPRIAATIMPVGTYIISTEPLGRALALHLIPHRVAVCDNNFVLDYYRLSADNRMLFGGRVSYSTLEPFKLTRSLRNRMLRVFPQLNRAKIDFSWGGYVAITRNRAPHIGQDKDGNWFAQGYSGHGMALTGYIGKVLSDAIFGDRDDLKYFEAVPHRIFPGGSLLRTPALVAAMGYFKLKDYL